MADLNRATRRLRREVKDIEADVTCDQDKFQCRIDCHNFRPEEVSVRNVGRDIMIEGKHEERADEHGFASRTFTRRYRLPDDCNAENVRCDLSSDGILTINVPRKAALTGGEKLLEIQQTGKPALPA
jgi:crystallin alpha B